MLIEFVRNSFESVDNENEGYDPLSDTDDAIPRKMPLLSHSSRIDGELC